MTSAISGPPPVPNRVPPRPPPPRVKPNMSDSELVGGSSLPGSDKSLAPLSAPPELPDGAGPKLNKPPSVHYENSPFTPAQVDIMEEAKMKGRNSVVLPGYGRVLVAQDAFKFTKKEEKRSKWGAMSWYLGMNCVVAAIVLGMVAMRLGSAGQRKEKWGGKDVLAGIFCFFGAFPLFYWEYFYGRSRVKRSYPLKGIVYIAAGIIPWISFGTITLAIFLWICGITNILSWREGEEYEERKKRKQKDHGPDYKIDIMDQLRKQLHTIIYQGEAKMYIFVAFWFFLNFVILVERWDYYFKLQKDENDAQGVKGLSPFWFGMAKGFGTLLDLNMSVILIPVCRTFIRFLYNSSTGGHSIWSRCLSWILSFTPLDKNLEFHKLLAAIVYVSAWAHTLAFLQFLRLSRNLR